MKGWPCIYRFTMPVLNNAVSDVIFAIFSDTISLGKLESRETEKEKKQRERKMSDPTSITSIPFCLLFITNLSRVYAPFPFAVTSRTRPEKNTRRRGENVGELRVKDLVTVSHKSTTRNEIRQRRLFFVKSLYRRALKKLSTDICIKHSRRLRDVIPFNVIKRRDASIRMCKAHKIAQISENAKFL